MHRSDTDLDNDLQGECQTGEDLTSMVERYKEYSMTPLRPQHSWTIGSHISTAGSILFHNRPLFDQPQAPNRSFESIPDGEEGVEGRISPSKARSMQNIESEQIAKKNNLKSTQCDQARSFRATPLLYSPQINLLQNDSSKTPILIRKYSDESALRSCLKRNALLAGKLIIPPNKETVKSDSKHNTTLWKSAPLDEVFPQQVTGSGLSLDVGHPKHVTFNSKLTVRTYKIPSRRKHFDDFE